MSLKNVKAFMIDLDGVVYTGNIPVEGAAKTLDFIRKKYDAFL